MEKTIGSVIAGLRSLGYDAFVWDSDYREVSDYSKAVELVVDKTYIKLPKKASTLTIPWVLSKVAKESVYQNFASEFNKVIQGAGLGSAYPTSYGIGLIVFGDRERVSETRKEVDRLLSKRGIEYTNEYSEAGLVFRYRISKSKENLKRL